MITVAHGSALHPEVQVLLDDQHRSHNPVEMTGIAFDAFTGRAKYAAGISLPPAIAEYDPTMSLDQFETETFTPV
jgi:hypothetical protein